MEKEKDAFYVVRKGDIVGIYKSLSDCQAQVGNSVCDPSVSVFKGYSLAKETEEYLNARGLQKATYTVNAADVNEDLFKDLVPCPFQQPPSSKGKLPVKVFPQKRSHEMLQSGNIVAQINGSSFHAMGPSKIIKHESSVPEQKGLCIVEFDGAAKGNPGPAGAGAVLRAENGQVLCRLHEGVGIATNNVAEYRAVLLGVKHALQKGFKRISVQGDSNLVVNQVQGKWKCKNDNMAMFCKQVKELKDKCVSFEIKHVYRDFNSEADAQANLGVHLRDHQVVVVDEKN
ncbi:uncharacterized protein LOC113297958 isoform X1 [Papaver somniferum]|uniref:uncharacterized protein LOC113297958 isoform X1 n=1 Tax=Papaver somniferum TaxID=3469 RepID=UPI000E7014E5|nr:uncharacterized protein LOC113297958 isoform X1 [Papaver somniferum]XP_026402358.1 uncharacterized protein LOC113297958 isoform X1 [Papaver somniferum]